MTPPMVIHALVPGVGALPPLGRWVDPTTERRTTDIDRRWSEKRPIRRLRLVGASTPNAHLRVSPHGRLGSCCLGALLRWIRDAVRG
jgi:hypothetical protein